MLGNDAGVVTESGPDSRPGLLQLFAGAKGPLPRGYLSVAPEAVLEVRSPSDRWSKVLAKISEYLMAGVQVVCVLDPDDSTATVQRSDQAPLRLQKDQELLLPEIHPEFRVQVGRFF